MKKRIAEVSALVASVLDLPATAIGPETSMENTPQWDSLAQLNICLAFQERFGISMDMDAITNTTSVAALTALLPGMITAAKTHLGHDQVCGFGRQGNLAGSLSHSRKGRRMQNGYKLFGRPVQVDIGLESVAPPA